MKYQIGTTVATPYSNGYRIVGYATLNDTRGYLVHRPFDGWLPKTSVFFEGLKDVEVDPEYADACLWFYYEEAIEHEVCPQCGLQHN